MNRRRMLTARLTPIVAAVPTPAAERHETISAAPVYSTTGVASTQHAGDAAQIIADALTGILRSSAMCCMPPAPMASVRTPETLSFSRSALFRPQLRNESLSHYTESAVHVLKGFALGEINNEFFRHLSSEISECWNLDHFRRATYDNTVHPTMLYLQPDAIQTQVLTEVPVVTGVSAHIHPFKAVAVRGRANLGPAFVRALAYFDSVGALHLTVGAEFFSTPDRLRGNVFACRSFI